MPWAISSWLGLWRSSMMLSAIRAHSNDSIAPNSASVKAGSNKKRAVSHENSGQSSVGRLLGTPPNRVPMVSTGMPLTLTSSVASTSATMEPGTSVHLRAQARVFASRGTAHCQPTIRPRHASASRVA